MDYYLIECMNKANMSTVAAEHVKIRTYIPAASVENGRKRVHARSAVATSSSHLNTTTCIILLLRTHEPEPLLRPRNTLSQIVP